MIALKSYLTRFTLIAAFALSATAQASQADFASCPQFFANNTPPTIEKQDGLKLRALCFSEFAVLHSGKSRTPFYVAEKLNRQSLQAAHKKRTDKFFADARLPRSERAELNDY
jgi:endonuclease G